MKPLLSIRYVLVKAIPLYKCVQCGKQEAGSTVHIELTDVMLAESEIAPIIERYAVHNNHMPVGWCGNGHYEHTCPDCTGE